MLDEAFLILYETLLIINDNPQYFIIYFFIIFVAKYILSYIFKRFNQFFGLLQFIFLCVLISFCNCNLQFILGIINAHICPYLTR